MKDGFSFLLFFSWGETFDFFFLFGGRRYLKERFYQSKKWKHGLLDDAGVS